eukprot:1498725-Prymnesium_polylepis.1
MAPTTAGLISRRSHSHKRGSAQILCAAIFSHMRLCRTQEMHAAQGEFGASARCAVATSRLKGHRAMYSRSTSWDLSGEHQRGDG